MRNILMTVLVVSSLLSCEKPKDPFLITKGTVATLNDSTQVKELKTLLLNDSIVRNIGGDEFTGAVNDISVYEKGGKLLFVLTPEQSLDSTSTIKTVRIMDDRFHSEKGINRASTYGDIRKAYKISGIQNTLRNVIVSVDEIDAYFTIDKSELPSDMRYNMDLKIDPIQIPDDAEIKDFYLQWY